MAGELSLYRVGVKFYLDKVAGHEPAVLIPVFHKWIQNESLPGLLIDVADYRHVPDGPVLMLIAHEGNYALDLGDGCPGVVYYRKRPDPRDPAELLREAARNALTAASLLAEETGITGYATLAGPFKVFAQDRLVAPNTDATAQALRSALEGLIAPLCAGAETTQQRIADPRAPFSVEISGLGESKAEDLLARLQ